MRTLILAAAAVGLAGCSVPPPYYAGGRWHPGWVPQPRIMQVPEPPPTANGKVVTPRPIQSAAVNAAIDAFPSSNNGTCASYNNACFVARHAAILADPHPVDIEHCELGDEKCYLLKQEAMLDKEQRGWSRMTPAQKAFQARYAPLHQDYLRSVDHFNEATGTLRQCGSDGCW